MMNRKWLIVATLLLVTGMTVMGVTAFQGVRWSVPAAKVKTGGIVTGAVEEGKQALYNHNILLAKQKFLEAVIADPANQEAQLFLGVVRVAALYEDQPVATPALDSIKEIADQFGITFKAYGLYNTDATIPKNLPDTAPNTGKVFDYVGTKALPEINAALQNLENVTNPDFTSLLQPSALDRSGNNYTIDYADVLTIKTLIYAAKATIELTLAYNWDVNIPSLIGTHPQKIKEFRALLVQHPLFGTPQQPARLTSAKTALHNFISTFNQASDQIGLRSVQNGHLFVFDAPVTNELATLKTAQVDEFKAALADIDASLYGPHLYSFINVADRDRTVDLSKLFNSTKPINIRGKVVSISDSGIVTDPTFGGIFPYRTSLNSHIVSTTVLGAGGSITPESRAVKDGSTTTFTVKHNYGYEIAGVSGCGGTLTGAIYKTGPITGDCTVTAAINALPMALTITSRTLVNPLSFNGKTGVISFAVTGATTQEELAVTVSSSDPWITAGILTYNARGKGNIKYTIAPNPTNQPRQGSINISGQSYTINQMAKPCKLILTPSLTTALPTTGGPITVGVAIDPADGNWAVSSVKWVPSTTPDWLQGFTLLEVHPGDGTLNLTVLTNTSGNPRSAVLTLLSGDGKSRKSVTIKQTK